MPDSEKPIEPRGFELERGFIPEHSAQVLDKVVARANHLIAAARVGAIGTLSITSGRFENEARWWPQLRSEPMPRLNGGEFRFNVPSCGPGLHPAACLDDELISAVRRFNQSQESIAEFLDGVSGISRFVIDRHRSATLPARLVALGVRAISAKEYYAVVELQALGSDLTLGMDRIEALLPNLEGRLETLLADHARRASLLDELQSKGARGRMEDTARRIMSAAGMDVGFALEQLRRTSKLNFDFDGGRVFGSIYWSEGTLRGDFIDRPTNARLFGDDFMFHYELPETLVASLPGRALGAVLTDPHPFLPHDTMIVEARKDDGELTLNLAIPDVLLPAPASQPSG